MVRHPARAGREWMNWRAALALGIIVVWFWLLLEARHDPVAKDLFDSVNPLALACVTFILAEPVIRDRRRRQQKRDDDDDDTADDTDPA